MPVLLYLSGVLTLIAVALMVALARHRRSTAPSIFVSGREEDDHPGLVTDPEDFGVRVTEIGVASSLPLSFVGARYTVQLIEDDAPRVHGGTHKEAVDALRGAGLDDATFGITLLSPTAKFAPGRDRVAFVLAIPVVRRLAVLEAEMTFVDALGRPLTKTVSALAKQDLGRPVRAEERQPVG